MSFARKVVHKTGEFIGNKVADKILKPKHVIDGNSRNVKKINISAKKEKKY